MAFGSYVYNEIHNVRLFVIYQPNRTNDVKIRIKIKINMAGLTNTKKIDNYKICKGTSNLLDLIPANTF